jgi:hypothetical protein
MLILFLNELSTVNIELDQFEARQRVLQLLNVLKDIRRQQQQVGMNSQVPLKDTLVDQRYSLAELLAGDEYRDEWRFLRGFANRSPLSAEMDTAFRLQVEEVEYHYQEQASIALGWADQLGTGVVSFPDANWFDACLMVGKRELNEAADIQECTVKVRNFAQLEHVTDHRDWLQKISFEWFSDAGIFWQQRETFFPFLRFMKQTEGHMDTLRVSGAAYYLALKRLHELNQDITRWVESGSDWPEFSSKATPEDETRKHLCEVMDNGEKHNFHWHLRFTGGIAGRIQIGRAHV